jgi:hypothetical protein
LPVGRAALRCRFFSTCAAVAKLASIKNSDAGDESSIGSAASLTLLTLTAG